MRQVPFYIPDIGEEEIDAVSDTLRSGWLTVGPKTKEFEEAFAEAVGANCAIAVNSCTAALHLALNSINLGQGDEVITSPVTFAATAATILHAGAKPVFADCSRDTLNIDPEDILRKITSKTRAIVPIHMAGHPAPMDEIEQIAEDHRLRVIEDAAHALPAKYRDRKIGSLSDMSAFSFYATKNLTTGEGGMLTLNRSEDENVPRTRRLHGMSKDAWKRYSAAGSWRYDISYPGFKYNMTDTAAAMGLVQLRRLPEMYRRRSELAAAYTAHLADCPYVELPVVRPGIESAWHLYIIKIRSEMLSIGRDEVIEELKEAGIGTGVHFIPLHQHSYYSERGYGDGMLPVATEISGKILSVPFYTKMSIDDVAYVCERLRDLLAAKAA